MTDEAAEEFVATADLTEYDLSHFVPTAFEFSDEEEVNVTLPKVQLDAVKALAERRGVPYRRLMRELIEIGLKTA
ncbi:CopG family antitoxin [Jiella avicenniae]|uniref:BrnA antitoxin family protein n=1 Tax=Jiella avicenniae TaxID=2907202 RepID=A0A9X1P5N5_9HYPH|nr:CopG family antitoxin [Jiella avicenniae]MCE7029763.1 BrnA antitoxin family protein [Jiella avicenniae]